MKKAVEMPGPWTQRKTKSRSPLRPQPLEIAEDAISTFPPPRRCPWKSGNPRAGFPLFHRLDFSLSKQLQGGLAAGRYAPPPGSPSVRVKFLLQAHSWMRTCCRTVSLTNPFATMWLKSGVSRHWPACFVGSPQQRRLGDQHPDQLRGRQEEPCRGIHQHHGSNGSQH